MTPTPTSTAAPARAPLGVDRILDAATALIEADGAESFSMRRLAASLGVTPMALYKWFDNRAALLDALGARVVDAVDLPDDPSGPWADRMLLVADALRADLLRRRSMLPLIDDHGAMELLMARTADRVLALLAEAGFDTDEAVERFRVFFWSIVGFVLRVDAGPTLPANDDRSAERQLAAAVDALSADTVPSLAAALPAFGPVDIDALFATMSRTLVLGLAADAPSGDVLSPRGTPRARPHRPR